MIFQAPALPAEYRQVIQKIETLREELRFATSDALHRWTGFLARMTYARAMLGSNTMEGINVTLDDAVAAVDRQEPLKPQDENWLALTGYREAMEYVIQLSRESYPYSQGTVLGLHYMLMKYDPTKNPGRWRPGVVTVTNTATGETVYEGPDAALVPELMTELFTYLNAPVEQHVLVRAAMAHLNLTLIHPFKDGNGRMARVLQTMVLAKEGILSPVFSSIEEYVGGNVLEYYAVLTEVGKGSWHPQNNALPWIRFCLTAHYRQAMTLLRRVKEAATLYVALEDEVKKRKLNERVMYALLDAAVGLSVKSPAYRQVAEVSDQVATLDLQGLITHGFLIAKGERRWRHYVASERLVEIRNSVRIKPQKLDPFEDLAAEVQPQLPGLAA